MERSPQFGAAGGPPRRQQEEDASLVDFIKVRRRPTARGAQLLAAAAPPPLTPLCRPLQPLDLRLHRRQSRWPCGAAIGNQVAGTVAAARWLASSRRGRRRSAVAPALSGLPPAPAHQPPVRAARSSACRSRPRRSRGTTAPRLRGTRATTATCRCWPPARPPSTARSRCGALVVFFCAVLSCAARRACNASDLGCCSGGGVAAGGPAAAPCAVRAAAGRMGGGARNGTGRVVNRRYSWLYAPPSSSGQPSLPSPPCFSFSPCTHHPRLGRACTHSPNIHPPAVLNRAGGGHRAAAAGGGQPGALCAARLPR